MSDFRATDEVRAAILALADAGWKADDIADEFGCHVQSVYRIAAGRLKVKGGRKGKDMGRLRRIVSAGDQAPKGARDDLASRFGLKNAHSFSGVLHYARKTLAAETRA